MSLLNWFNVVPGYFQEPYLPTRRGFDTFLGMYESGIDYYMHTRETEGFWGLDMHWDMGCNYSEPMWDLYGDYATDLFTQHARIVNQFARIQMFKVHFEPAVKQYFPNLLFKIDDLCTFGVFDWQNVHRKGN